MTPFFRDLFLYSFSLTRLFHLPILRALNFASALVPSLIRIRRTSVRFILI